MDNIPLALSLMEKQHRKNFIKEIRKQRGLTQKELGDLVGVADSQITMIENGRRGLRAEMLHRIADALQCHPLDITDGPGNAVVARSEREKKLLETFRAMQDKDQENYLVMGDIFAGGGPKATELPAQYKKGKKTT